MTDEITYDKALDELESENANLLAEVERLRAALACEIKKRQRQVAEAIRANGEAFDALQAQHDQSMDTIQAENTRLQAEVERLRALVAALVTRHPLDDHDLLQAELMLDPEYQTAYIAEIKRDNHKVWKENISLRSLMGELVAAADEPLRELVAYLALTNPDSIQGERLRKMIGELNFLCKRAGRAVGG